MRALLDVNLLIALLDPDHIFHERGHEWWAANHEIGWASCPLTENGVVRIMSNPNYSERLDYSPGDLIKLLRRFAKQSDHEFWPDDLSFRDKKAFAFERIHGSRQLTDVYLLALAARNGGRLVTFDSGIPLSAVTGANADHLCVV
ncbi:MAG: TA system VapC family ribonuclease toxin [Pyrinomonadaceae bacterium]